MIRFVALAIGFQSYMGGTVVIYIGRRIVWGGRIETPHEMRVVYVFLFRKNSVKWDDTRVRYMSSEGRGKHTYQSRFSSYMLSSPIAGGILILVAKQFFILERVTNGPGKITTYKRKETLSWRASATHLSYAITLNSLTIKQSAKTKGLFWLLWHFRGYTAWFSYTDHDEILTQA